MSIHSRTPAATAAEPFPRYLEAGAHSPRPDDRMLSSGTRLGPYEIVAPLVPILAARDANEYPTDWTDRFIVYEREDTVTKTQADIFALPLGGGAPIAVVQTAGMDSSGRVSPDGRWLAYSSTESGRAEIYVTSFPQPRGRWQISQQGGLAPTWRGDGRELFFVNGGKVFAAPITAGETLDAGVPVELFSARMKSLPPPFYDVTPDGSRFLVNLLPESGNDPIAVVMNWPAALQGK